MEKSHSEAEQFRNWILSRHTSDYIFRLDGTDKICLDTDYARGQVVFNLMDQFDVIELSITSLRDQEIVFYLHFELNDLAHAEELYEEMERALRRQKNRQRIRVLLCCSSGITTSYFVEKMRSAADLLSLDMDFTAVSYNNLFVKGFNADVILLAPQISYLYEKAVAILKEKTIIVIPASVFAAYDVSRLLTLIQKTREEEKQRKREHMRPIELIEFTNTPDLIIVSIIVEYNHIRMIYRIYERGTPVYQDAVIKEVYQLRDLEDMLDVVIARWPKVEMVCVNTPGVVTDGHLTFHSANIENVDVQTIFSNRYHRRFIFTNDANIMAMGFYALQTDTRNISFYFHPHAARTAGVGNIMNGQLIQGRNSLSGEMQYVHKITSYSKDPAVLARTPEGTMEIVTKYLVSIIATMDPDMIGIYCDMVPDMEELKKSLAQYIQEPFIPELVKVDNVIEIMFIGGMMMCVETIAKEHLRYHAGEE